MYTYYRVVGDTMYENKYLVSLYVLALDETFEIFLPANEKVGNILKLLNGSIINNANNGMSLLSFYSGYLYNYNDIVRNTDIRNGTKLILI